MYYISKRIEVAGAHNLKLPYESKCENLHGHNWIITIYCKSRQLTDFGMIVDFKKIKTAISDRIDHQYLNNVIEINPTAENMAKWICDEVNNICEVGCCYKVSVQESEGNTAIYERDDNEG